MSSDPNANRWGQKLASLLEASLQQRRDDMRAGGQSEPPHPSSGALLIIDGNVWRHDGAGWTRLQGEA